MVETIASGLIITSITGITFVAYKHPDAYKKINNILFLVNSGIAILVALWNTIVIFLTYQIISEFKDFEITEIIKQKGESFLISFLKAYIIIVGVYGYLLLLSLFPLLFGSNEKKNEYGSYPLRTLLSSNLLHLPCI